MATVKTMTIIVNSLLPRPKLYCDVGYDAAVKGASVVVEVKNHAIDFIIYFFHFTYESHKPIANKYVY